MLRISLCITLFCGAAVMAASQVAYPPQEVDVGNLPLIRAESTSGSDVLAASVATVLHNEVLCCGRNSALRDTVLSSDPSSLKEVASTLQGKHLLSDGRSFTMMAEFWPAASVNSDQIINALMNQHALVMEWNSHIYVVYGVIFNESVSYNGAATQKNNVIQELLLIDPRYSDARRNAFFDRSTDRWDDVQGLLYLKAKLP